MMINFYSHKKQYGWMSNFYESPIVVNNVSYPTTEHYFQAMKMTNENDANTVKNARTAASAAKYGRSLPMRTDWNLIRDDVMLVALRAKFYQHLNLADSLMKTGDAYLVEHTINDSYWGDGGNGTGCNMLGKLLMKVRGELLEKWTQQH